MNDEELKEKVFEETIEEYLIAKGGYEKGNHKKFNIELVLDIDNLIEFVEKSQSQEWEKYQTIDGSVSEESFIKRFCKEVKTNGLLAVSRRGFKDRRILFKVAYFKPETTINEEIIKLYNDGSLHYNRQLYYSLRNENSIDIVLFLNSIQVVSMELKC